MDSYQISLEISRTQDRLSAAQSRLSSLCKNKADVEDLSRKHSSMRTLVASDMEARARRLDTATIDPLKVRSFAAYKTAMQGKLANGQRLVSSMDDATTRINRAIDDIDQEIAAESRSCDSIESEISALRVKYNNAKVLEAAL